MKTVSFDDEAYRLLQGLEAPGRVLQRRRQAPAGSASRHPGLGRRLVRGARRGGQGPPRGDGGRLRGSGRDLIIVADSSVLIAHLRGDEGATAFLEEEQERGSVLAPSLVAWELWRGAGTPDQRDGVEALLEGLWVDSFSAAMAPLAGELDRTMGDRGEAKPTYDLLIASPALFHDAPLATMDRDYDAVDRLQVVGPRGS